MLMCPNLSFRLTFLKTVDICATSSFLNGRCNFSHLPKIFAGKKIKDYPLSVPTYVADETHLIEICASAIFGSSAIVWFARSVSGKCTRGCFFSCCVTSANLPLRDWENLCSIYAPASQSQNDNLEKFCLMTWQQQPQNLNLTWCTIWSAGTCSAEIRAAS